MTNLYAIYSKSLNHYSKFFFADSNESAMDIVRTELFRGQDFGLFLGAKNNDLELVCAVSDCSEFVSCLSEFDFCLPLKDIPTVADFIENIENNVVTQKSKFDSDVREREVNNVPENVQE